MPNRLTIDQMDVVNDVSMAISVASLCGSLFILFCFFYFRNLRKFSFKLVAILSFCDAFNQAFDLVQPSARDIIDMEQGITPVDVTCYVQAAGDTFFELSSVLWTTAIAATLYLTVQHKMKLEDSPVAMLCFCVVAFGLPAVVTIAPAVDHAFGPAGGWCWIIEEKAFWRFACFYGPLWAAMLFNVCVYVWIWRTLQRVIRGQGIDPGTASIRTMMTRLQLYPFILLVVWLFASINRVYELASDGNQIFALYLLQRSLSSAQGLLNAFAYGFSGGVREAIRESFGPYCWFMAPVCSACCCCCPRDSHTGSTLLTTHVGGGSGMLTGGHSIGSRSDSLSQVIGGGGGGGASTGAGKDRSGTATTAAALGVQQPHDAGMLMIGDGGGGHDSMMEGGLYSSSPSIQYGSPLPSGGAGGGGGGSDGMFGTGSLVTRNPMNGAAGGAGGARGSIVGGSSLVAAGSFVVPGAFTVSGSMPLPGVLGAGGGGAYGASPAGGPGAGVRGIGIPGSSPAGGGGRASAYIGGAGSSLIAGGAGGGRLPVAASGRTRGGTESEDDDDLDINVIVPASHSTRPGESLRVNKGHVALGAAGIGGSSRLSGAASYMAGGAAGGTPSSGGTGSFVAPAGHMPRPAGAVGASGRYANMGSAAAAAGPGQRTGTVGGRAAAGVAIGYPVGAGDSSSSLASSSLSSSMGGGLVGSFGDFGGSFTLGLPALAEAFPQPVPVPSPGAMGDGSAEGAVGFAPAADAAGGAPADGGDASTGGAAAGAGASRHERVRQLLREE